MIENKVVIVRGGGDLASGTINRLHNMGFKVLVLEIEKPNFIRRKVCYGQAVYEKEFLLEGIVSERADNLDEIKNIWADGRIPVYIDSQMEIVSKIKPIAVIDAIIAKKNLGMRKGIAPITIALGPGFEAGKDVDVVIETQRGHNLGRIIFEGFAAENTGVPGIIKGYGKERVIHAPASGKLKIVHDIGSIVQKDEIIAYIDSVPVYASLTGLIRGMIREGSIVEKGLKISDIDPREEELKNCYTISDKARTISGGVAEALFYLMNRLSVKK
ncbi:EF2563 family selenium-dependent molybdenum hydroxylase system protein [Fusobacterium perfoetens]|uniref:selenium-dependent molybdenum cofactor biosynthesis protein YqeB n=1 Tax=Fusobacterium perfoetens TaxID=852 RepID=UPI0015A044BD|nr:selenium-dependent molybdenum cofactor biosynthesis protein YqeB [Fusobacterium perfoetens]MCF2625667.1 EF2563 family selenium-dependent molybdenum hydroxylase system protein [Fusobacterium perfoetens]